MCDSLEFTFKILLGFPWISSWISHNWKKLYRLVWMNINVTVLTVVYVLLQLIELLFLLALLRRLLGESGLVRFGRLDDFVSALLGWFFAGTLPRFQSCQSTFAHHFNNFVNMFLRVRVLFFMFFHFVFRL